MNAKTNTGQVTDEDKALAARIVREFGPAWPAKEAEIARAITSNRLAQSTPAGLADIAAFLETAGHHIYPQPDRPNGPYAKLQRAKQALATLRASPAADPEPAGRLDPAGDGETRILTGEPVLRKPAGVQEVVERLHNNLAHAPHDATECMLSLDDHRAIIAALAALPQDEVK